MEMFEELILISLGKQNAFSRTPTTSQWKKMLEDAQKHSIVGILFSGIEQLPLDQRPPELIFLEWFGITNLLMKRNKLLDKRAAELALFFKENGFLSCILKGQGIARLYPNPERRSSGDIDVWVSKEQGRSFNRNTILDFLFNKELKIGSVVFHHVDVEIFNDVTVELHFIPNYTYNPFRMRKYSLFFTEEANKQFSHFDEKLGFSYPTNFFNAVFSFLHIFKHLMYEGIGLRQLMDYYYILMCLTEHERSCAMEILEWMGLKKVVQAIMYVEQSFFLLEDEKLLCNPDEKNGKMVKDEIMRSGNFGKYDARYKNDITRGLMRFFIERMNKLLTFYHLCPSEVLYAPLWKIWHFFWRLKFRLK